MTHWIYLTAAILLEVSGTTSMKLSFGFTRLWPSVFVAVFYLASLAALTMALKAIDVSVAYAIWSGLGTAIIAAVGIVYFGEPASAVKFASLLLIIVGVAGLHLSSAHP